MIKTVKQLLLSQTSKDTSVIFVSNAISSILAVIFVVIAGRYLGPENLGIAMVVVSFVAIVSSFADLGLGAGLFRFVSKHHFQNNPQKTKEYLSSIFSLRLVIATLTLVFFVVFPSTISHLLLKKDFPELIILSGVAIFGFLLWDFQVQSLQSRGKFLASSIPLVSLNLLRLALLVVFVLLGTINLITGTLSYAIVPLVIFLLFCLVSRPTINLKLSTSTIKEIFSFSGWMGANKIVSTISGRIDSILLLQLLTPLETGLYAASRQLSQGVPIFLGSLATVLAPRLASLKKENLRSYYKKSFLLSLFVAFLLIVLAAISPVITVFFGDKYQNSVPVFRWLVVSFIPLALSTAPVNAIIYSLHKPNFISTLSIIQLPIIVLGNIMLIPQYGVFAPVAIFLFNHTFSLVASVIYVETHKEKLYK